MSDWFMGIDPGTNGAMAFYNGDHIFVYDFVTVKGGSSTNQYHKANHRKTIAVFETASIIKTHAGIFGMPKLVYLETPHSMPNDGHVGAFNFGKACGVIDGILGTLGLTVIPANPAAWKSAMGLSSNKEKSLIKARELFPNDEDLFELKKHNDRAEAALLAWYAHKIFGGAKK